jgi:hypothetical protein
MAILEQFCLMAQSNTDKPQWGVETMALLFGSIADQKEWQVRAIIVPRQTVNACSCIVTPEGEEKMAQFALYVSDCFTWRHFSVVTMN